MRKYLLLYVCLLFGLLVKGQQTEYYFRFLEADKNKINTEITRIISIHNISADTVYAFANLDEFNKFLKLGYKIELLPQPSLTTKVLNMATTIDQMANWDRYPTYEVYRAMMKKFEQDYPTLCKLDSIGTTPGGRKLYVIKLSDNVSASEPETQFLYTSTMHGDETTGYLLLLRLIDYLLKNYSSNSRVNGILDNLEIFINPNANPDGTYKSGNSTLSGADRPNANNVDLNRNFPDPRVGLHPDGYSWQPETQAMMNFAASQHLTLSANFHGGVEVVNYPWDAWISAQKLHADNNWFRQISRIYADSAQANSPIGYFDYLEDGITNGGDWYVVYGGRQDYMNWWHKCREVTIEISNTMLLSTDLLSSFWNYNQASLISYIEAALHGVKGIIKNTLGAPLNAKVYVLIHDADSSHIYSDASNGFYTRLIEPGTWNFLYTSPGYSPQIHSIDVANWQTLVLKDITLVNESNCSLSGTITNLDSGNPISDVQVEILNSNYLPISSDQVGEYSFTIATTGDYIVKFTKSGYQNQLLQVNATNPTNVLNTTLTPANYEGFENTTPAGFNFVNGTWFNDNSTKYEGESSLRSAQISNSTSTSMSISLNISAAADIKFARKTSSESGFDFLFFYIDDIEKGKWSGEQNWAVQSYPVTTGEHILRWKYQKDSNTSSGTDCAWIDSIVFPQSSQDITFSVLYNSAPCNFATVNFDGQTLQTDANGDAIFQNVPRGVDKTYSVTKSTLDPANGIIDVSYTDITKPITLTGILKYTVTFTVKHDQNPLQNVSIMLNQTEVFTAVDGIATFNNVPQGTNYCYKVSLNGYNTYTGQTDVLGDVNIPIDLIPVGIPIESVDKLIAVWPNPFTSKVNISLNLENASNLELSIYSIDGRKIKTLANGFYSANNHNFVWDGCAENGNKIPSGIYLIRLQTEKYSILQKIQSLP